MGYSDGEVVAVWRLARGRGFREAVNRKSAVVVLGVVGRDCAGSRIQVELSVWTKLGNVSYAK